MSLLKRSESRPLGPFADMQRMMDRLTDMWGNEGWGPGFAKLDWAPTANVTETRNAYVIKAELPEVKKEDVQVQLEYGVLSISGERKYVAEEDDEKQHRVEAQYGRFSRSFRLPEDAATEGVEANFSGGVLKVKVPKLKEPKSQGTRIEVR